MHTHSDALMVRRIVAHVWQRFAALNGKILGGTWRLTWEPKTLTLEEMPDGTKNKVRKAVMRTHLEVRWLGDRPELSPETLVRNAGVSKSDRFEHVLRKITEAKARAGQDIQNRLRAHFETQDLMWLLKPKWDETWVLATEVMPEKPSPFRVEGRDFEILVEWDDFKARSTIPPQSGDIAVVESSAPVSAHKLYQTLRPNTHLLNNMTWDQFDDWLKRNRIGFALQFAH